MGDFDSLYRCSLGGSAFQLGDYRYAKRGLVDSSGTRIGSEVTIEGDGWIEADTQSALATAIAAADASFSSSGFDFEVYGPGDVRELLLTAAESIEGGPHARFTMLPQLDAGALVKAFSFAVTAKTRSEEDDEGGNGEAAINYRQRTTTTPDDLTTISRSGEQLGMDRGEFETRVLAPFRLQHPLPQWVVSHEFEEDSSGGRSGYVVSAQQLANPYVTSAGAAIVDGDGAYHVERDEQMRLVRTWEFDLLITGDYAQILPQIRPPADEGVILHESIRVTLFKQVRLQASFQILAGGNGNKLMDWQESFDWEKAEQTHGVRRYPGITPLLLRDDEDFSILTQSGIAVGAGAYPKPPTPVFMEYLVGKPRISFSDQDAVRKQTRWTYTMAVPVNVAAEHPSYSSRQHSYQPADLRRDDDPSFYPGGGS